MKLRQYARLELLSNTLSAEQISEAVGLRANYVVVRASRRVNPPVPRLHIWAIECRLPDLGVNEQLTHVLDQVMPMSDRLLAVAASAEVMVELAIVRYFEEVDVDYGPSEDWLPYGELDPDDIMGWRLTVDQLSFLAALGARVMVDEHNYAADDNSPDL